MTIHRILSKMALLLLVASGSALAQTDSKPVLPPGPLVSKIPNPGTWTVTFTYPQESTKGQQAVPDSIKEFPRTLTMETAGGITHVTITKIGGTIQNLWKSGDVDYERFGNDPWAVGVKNAMTSSVYLDATDFPTLDWLQPSLYMGPAKYEGEDCLLFVMGNNVGGITPDDPSTLGVLADQGANFAVINLQSRLPMEVVYGGVKEIFEYGSAPKKLSLPTDLTNQIMQGKRYQAAHNVPALRPY